MKSWKKSKTLWLNALAAALIALEASTGILKPLLGDSFYLIMAGLLPVANAALRVLTTESLGKSKDAEP